MSLILRALAHAPESVSCPFFSRSFSVHRGAQEKGDYTRLRQQNSENYRQLLDKHALYKKQWLTNPENVQRARETTRLYYLAHKEDERRLFYMRLIKWCTRYTWFRETLPWKSDSPVLYEHRVEHHCEGCNWTKRGGRKLWWKKIPSSPATEVDSWLCSDCYVPKAADWGEAMPRGYEDLTTIKEVAKRRDQLGHGA
ncbi:hypothetical protein M436DRAFT_78708 [Aureobasidium namibiae CBS 147.97]|uniref:Uncharacterized protein n=1 Tax=Aureobasidium namibiae CBS 147.97 TaxID=1043004 RepID=A0A074WUT4_9PEZI|nr:uncharacterized protein M436DRAFT_78708 [Aureobasidium namibiae CBS 147.97]KEQ76980.1 hypothetical protein M436DRAFT_78708 [Aureobasidium namibiae CBS 147.97]